MLEIRRKVFYISLPIQNCMNVSNFEKAQNHRTLIGIFNTLLCQTADGFDYQPWKGQTVFMPCRSWKWAGVQLLYTRIVVNLGCYLQQPDPCKFSSTVFPLPADSDIAKYHPSPLSHRILGYGSHCQQQPSYHWLLIVLYLTPLLSQYLKL